VIHEELGRLLSLPLANPNGDAVGELHAAIVIPKQKTPDLPGSLHEAAIPLQGSLAASQGKCAQRSGER
jgi:hypothetical protein